MTEPTNFAFEEDDASQSQAVSAEELPVDIPQEAAVPQRGPESRVKNLDTGEEFDIEEYDTRLPLTSGHHSASGDADLAEAPDDVEEQSNRGLGGKKKAWLKNTKKLKTWAKTTLTNVKEKIEERIEKQLQQQQVKRQLKQQASRDKAGSIAAWASGGKGTHGLGEAQLSDLAAPLEHGALEGPYPAQADSALTDFLDGGERVGEEEEEGGVSGEDDSLCGLSHGTSFNGSLASASTEAMAFKKRPLTAAALDTGDGDRAGKVADGGGATAAAPGSSLLETTLPLSLDPSCSGSSSRGERGYPPLAPAAAAAEATRRSAAAPKKVGTGGGGGDGGGGGRPATRPPHFPPLPPSRGLTSQPVAAAATATAAARPLAPPVAAKGNTIPLADGEGQQQQRWEEMRTPLLEDDLAGPSSRAVPTAKSWLNQAARVAGGRRASGRQLQQVRMIQELLGHAGPVWVIKFSADARLLATAGRDGVLRVWSVYWYAAGRSKLISPARKDLPAAQATRGAPAAAATHGGSTNTTSISAASGTTTAAGSGTTAPRLPLLSESPLLSLAGHRGDVLDLCWSQCRLLMTASADQTARLWLIDVPVGAPALGAAGGVGVCGGDGGGDAAGRPPSAECLRSFVHPDFVTSCCFHPTEPGCVVTGCADGKIRVWSIADAIVLTSATVQQDMITRVLFSADGRRVVGGTLYGKARHYEFRDDALEYLTQLDVKNPHGSGRKVTGLVQVPYTYGNDQLYVITSADSRIRLYVGYTQERKFKGHRNKNTQIGASLSPSCQHLICGSDDGWVYVWETGLPPPPPPSSPGPSQPCVGSLGGAGARVAAAAAGAVPPQRAGIGAGAREAALLERVSCKVKEGTYAAFQTPEATTTVAIFAPDVCRLGRGFERVGAPVAEGATTTLPLLGALFVVAGFSGKIYAYENLPTQMM